MDLSTCVVVGIILATPDKTTIYYADVPYGSVIHVDLAGKLADFAFILSNEVKVVSYLSQRPPEARNGCRPSMYAMYNGGLY